MSGSLLVRPLRLGIRATELVMHEAVALTERALRLAGIVGAPADAPPADAPPAGGPPADAPPGADPRNGDAGPARPRQTMRQDPPSAARPAPHSREAAERAIANPPIADPVDDRPREPIFAEPAHVSEDPVRVDEAADSGAVDGAGAQVHIAAPWEGYRAMTAADIINRLAASSREELATVQLYELSARNRKTVMAAARRALKRASPPR